MVITVFKGGIDTWNNLQKVTHWLRQDGNSCFLFCCFFFFLNCNVYIYINHISIYFQIIWLRINDFLLSFQKHFMFLKGSVISTALIPVKVQSLWQCSPVLVLFILIQTFSVFLFCLNSKPPHFLKLIFIQLF